MVAFSIDETSGVVYVFVDAVDWYPERLGTVGVGGMVMLTRPLMAITKLPWPPDETFGMVCRLGELANRPNAGRLVSSPPPASSSPDGSERGHRSGRKAPQAPGQGPGRPSNHGTSKQFCALIGLRWSRSRGGSRRRSPDHNARRSC